MAKAIQGHPCRKVLFDLMVVSDRTYYVFGHDNPKVEKADDALAETIKLLRTAVEWQEQHDPEVSALTQHQIDQANEALRLQLDPEYREQCLEDAEQAAHEKRRFDLERLAKSNDQEDMHPSVAEAMEAIRELLTISRSVQPGRSAEEHQRTILETLPALMGTKSGYAFAYPDLIDQVFGQEGLNG